MSNLPKYRSTIEEHVKLSQQLLGIGGEALVEAPTEKIAAAGAVDISTMGDDDLIAKLAESEEGSALLAKWEIYGAHLGNVKFAEDAQDEGLAKVASEGISEFLTNTFGAEGFQKIASDNASGVDAIEAFLNAHS